MPTVDSLDARLLLALDEDPNATILSLARTLGVARNTAHARLARLTESGAIKEFSRRLDPAALGYGLMAFVSVAISQTRPDVALAGLRLHPEVIEIHSTTGDADFLVKVVARDTQDLHRITNAILTIEGIVRTNTTVSLIETMPLRISALLRSAANGQ
ncbi:Lrp/AsnC family transcriptional regulator [Nakamurella antarctica]|uniref:Lrp/AsnC family transcriptional regulator n=1 Tax=Nakamurella antarctica TaxID=1902245 RepID=A0A3G8ZN53_9ACTN|nr:Lrp/AsnC family transcriptional regulator [Nakamurella antarctica]AZI58225.1 Lrp/AsnC family transcriptional regulator [Nakamurella antarctica]